MRKWSFLLLFVALAIAVLPPETSMSWRLGLMFVFLIYPTYCLLDYIPGFRKITTCIRWIVSCILLIFGLFLFSHSISSKKETLSPELTLRCDYIMLPIPWKEGSVYFIQINGRFASQLGKTLTGADRLPTFWPAPGMKQSEAFRYTVTNHGKVSAYNTSMNFGIVHEESIRNNGTINSGKVVYTYNSPINIEELDSNGGNFIFYIYNNLSADFIGIEPPAFAILDGKQKITLKHIGDTRILLMPHDWDKTNP